MRPFQAIFACFAATASCDITASHVRTYNCCLRCPCCRRHGKIPTFCYILLQSMTVGVTLSIKAISPPKMVGQQMAGGISRSSLNNNLAMACPCSSISQPVSHRLRKEFLERNTLASNQQRSLRFEGSGECFHTAYLPRPSFSRPKISSDRAIMRCPVHGRARMLPRGAPGGSFSGPGPRITSYEPCSKASGGGA